MLNNKIKYVIFDLDDTIYKEKDYVLQAMKEVAKYIYKKNKKKKMEDVFNRFIEILEKDGRGQIFNKFCKEENMDFEIMDLVKAYRATKPILKMYPDTFELIKNLKDKGIKVGIITDGDKIVQRNKIDGLEVGKYVDAIIITDEFDLSKPDERVYKLCLEKLEAVDARRAVYIGDNPTKDFIGAKIMGLKTIRIVREVGDHMKIEVEEKYNADYTIHNMGEVLAICQI